jgi:hypothetical protein
MTRPGKIALGLAVAAGVYLLLPLIIFDFTSLAVPHDEDNFDGKGVAIGPRPRWWIPGAAYDFDIPGGPGYDASGWPFVVWKPLCVWFVKSKGYALPSEWR